MNNQKNIVIVPQQSVAVSSSEKLLSTDMFENLWKRGGILTVSLVLCIFAFVSLGFQNEICAHDTDNNEAYSYENIKEIEWGYTQDQYVKDMTGFGDIENNDSYIIMYAEEILNGRLFVSNIFKGMPYSLDDLDWYATYSESPNTFLLYMNGLTFLQILSKAFILTDNVDYLFYAEKLLDNWYNYSHYDENSSDNTMLWGDHTAAIRAESILCFAVYSIGTEIDTTEFRNKINDLLIEHAIFLADDAHYTENHNHGIIQDCALIKISYFLSSTEKETWINIGLNRLKAEKDFAFNSEMIHVENSSGYNIGVIEFFYSISIFLNNVNDAEGAVLSNDIHRTAEFLAWITMPNGITAQFGDSESSKLTKVSTTKYQKYGNNRLDFASSLGAIDMMNEKEKSETVKYYPLSGYWIYREDWDSVDSSSKTWKLFKSGYQSGTHKHADDLSIMIYSKGYEIISDSGCFNYMAGNQYRDYFVSSSAHSTVTVDEKSYSIMKESAVNVGMLAQKSTAMYDYVSGFNNMYNGTEIDRHLYSSGDLTIIYDDIVSGDKHNYDQLFHLSEHMDVVSSNNNSALLSIADTGYFVRIRQYTSTKLSLFSGREDDKPLYGHLSRTINEMEDITTLRYRRNAKNAEFITIITIEDSNGMVKLKDGTSVKYSDISYGKNTKTIKFADENILLESRDRFYAKATAEVDDSNLMTIKAKAYPDCRYLYYVTNSVTGEVLYRGNWSDDPIFTYSLEECTDDIFIKEYITSKVYSQRKNAIVSALVYDEESGLYKVDDGSIYPYLNLEYFGHSYEKLIDGSYCFNVNYNYSWNTNFKWYVYRNGSYYTVARRRNTGSFYFSFAEPGDYTVSYYLTTSNGDNFYYNFESIKIE